MVNPSVQKEWQKFVKEKATQRGFFDTTGASRLYKETNLTTQNTKLKNLSFTLTKLEITQTILVCQKDSTCGVDDAFHQVQQSINNIIHLSGCFPTNNLTAPFLGSSVDHFKLVEEEIEVLKIPEIASKNVATTRSLN
ncbi:hypothetical protein CU098_009705, partial [Rhizopus stolonifer]